MSTDLIEKPAELAPVEAPRIDASANALAPRIDASAILALVAAQPDLNPETVERMFALAEREREHHAKVAFAAAMSAAQAELRIIERDAYNDQTRSNYSKYETTHAAIMPAVTRHGLSLSFGTGEATAPEETRYTLIIMHTQGHREERYIDLPLDDRGIKGNPNKTAIHGKVSASSYARRALCDMALNLAHGQHPDTDGNPQEAIGPITPEQSAELAEIAAHPSVDWDAFVDWLEKSAGTRSIGDIPSTHYAQVRRLLRGKIAKSIDAAMTPPDPEAAADLARGAGGEG